MANPIKISDILTYSAILIKNKSIISSLKEFQIEYGDLSVSSDDLTHATKAEVVLGGNKELIVIIE